MLMIFLIAIITAAIAVLVKRAVKKIPELPTTRWIILGVIVSLFIIFACSLLVYLADSYHWQLRLLDDPYLINIIVLIIAITTTVSAMLLLVCGIKTASKSSIARSSFLLGVAGMAWMFILMNFLSVNFGLY